MTDQQLRHTYRILLKKYHPDTGGDTADETAIRHIIEEYHRLASRQQTQPKAAENTKSISAWTEPKSVSETNELILSMLKLIAARRTADMPIRILTSHIAFCADNDDTDSLILTLTALAEIYRLSQMSDNEYDAAFETVMRQITEYARNISEAESKLAKLNMTAAPKAGLVRDILRSVRVIQSETLRTLVNAYLVLIISL